MSNRTPLKPSFDAKAAANPKWASDKITEYRGIIGNKGKQIAALKDKIAALEDELANRA